MTWLSISALVATLVGTVLSQHNWLARVGWQKRYTVVVLALATALQGSDIYLRDRAQASAQAQLVAPIDIPLGFKVVLSVPTDQPELAALRTELVELGEFPPWESTAMQPVRSLAASLKIAGSACLDKDCSSGSQAMTATGERQRLDLSFGDRCRLGTPRRDPAVLLSNDRTQLTMTFWCPTVMVPWNDEIQSLEQLPGLTLFAGVWDDGFSDYTVIAMSLHQNNNLPFLVVEGLELTRRTGSTGETWQDFWRGTLSDWHPGR